MTSTNIEEGGKYYQVFVGMSVCVFADVRLCVHNNYKKICENALDCSLPVPVCLLLQLCACYLNCIH